MIDYRFLYTKIKNQRKVLTRYGLRRETILKYKFVGKVNNELYGMD